jgi:hypothetical protein
MQPVLSCDDDQTFESGRKQRIDIGILGDGLRDHESPVCLLLSIRAYHSGLNDNTPISITLDTIKVTETRTFGDWRQGRWDRQSSTAGPAT